MYYEPTKGLIEQNVNDSQSASKQFEVNVKNFPHPASISLFWFFQQLKVNVIILKFCLRLDSNYGLLELEGITLLTEPQPLPILGHSSPPM